jgi:hypothetical protein
MGMAAMGDIVPRNKLAQASANMAVCMGLGLLASPMVSSVLTAIGTYKAAVVMAIFQLVTDQLLVRLWGVLETF